MFTFKPKKAELLNEHEEIQATIGIPLQAGEKLLKHPELNRVITVLKNQISITHEHWDNIYGKTISNLAAILQIQSVSQTDNKLLLTQQIERSIAILKIGEGKMIPQSIKEEERNAYFPAWTYALFCLGVLHDIDVPLNSRTVVYFDKNAKQLGLFSPLLNCPEQAVSYQLHWESPKQLLPKTVFFTALTQRIVPSSVMLWISSYSGLFYQWWNIYGEVICQSELSELFQSALKIVQDAKLIPKQLELQNAEKDEIPTKHIQKEKNKEAISIEEPTKDADSEPQQPTISAQLLTWLSQLLVNENPFFEEHCFRVELGLFVERQTIQKYIEKQNKPLDELLQLLQSETKIVLNHQTPWHPYCSSDYTQRHTLEGLVFDVNALDKPFHDLPITKAIVPDELNDTRDNHEKSD